MENSKSEEDEKNIKNYSFLLLIVWVNLRDCDKLNQISVWKNPDTDIKNIQQEWCSIFLYLNILRSWKFLI